MPIVTVVEGIQWLGGLLAYASLGVILYGIWRGSQRQAGRTTGSGSAWLRSAWFYLAATALFLGLGWMGWISLPVTLLPRMQAWMLGMGCLLYFPGLALVLWGRTALGKNYFVSTGFGAQLFAGHRLVTDGPYAFVRHPMYTGLFLAALGSLLIYWTWTTLLLACFAPFTALRARREEQVLAVEFGEQWWAYARRTGKFFPGGKIWLRK